MNDVVLRRGLGHTERHQGLMYSEAGLCKEEARGQPFANEGESPQKKPTLWAPMSVV